MSEPGRVAVIRGGDSAEREVSLKSGRAVEEALEQAPCEVFAYDTERTLGEQLRGDGIDVAFLALHGRGGEDGVIQGLLEWHGIPYTGPGVAASALCMDKIRCKQVFDRAGLATPEWFKLAAGEPPRARRSFGRFVVKPRFEGSSLGMSIVDETELETAVEEARQYDDDLLIEQYIEGYEVTVGVVRLDRTRILPPVGIRPSHEFFDYETKYTKGLTEYDVPADVDRTTRRRLEQMTRAVAEETGTEDLCRVDYILDEQSVPRVLEINTIPGLTETSLLPKAASLAGLPFPELVWSMSCAAARRTKRAGAR